VPRNGVVALVADVVVTLNVDAQAAKKVAEQMWLVRRVRRGSEKRRALKDNNDLKIKTANANQEWTANANPAQTDRGHRAKTDRDLRAKTDRGHRAKTRAGHLAKMGPARLGKKRLGAMDNVAMGTIPTMAPAEPRPSTCQVLNAAPIAMGVTVRS